MKKRVFKNYLIKQLVVLLLIIMLAPFISTSVQAGMYKEIVSLDNYNNKRVEYRKSTVQRELKSLGDGQLEDKYDIRSIISTGIQGTLDICWAFANKNMIESYLNLKENVNIELSARHMDYAQSNKVTNSINRVVGSAAPPNYTLAYFSTNQGPVKESNFPYNTEIRDITQNELNQNIEDIYLEGYNDFPIINKMIVDGRMEYQVIDSVKIYDNFTDAEIVQFRNTMKKHIKENGAISAGIYTGSAQVTNSAEQFIYYKPNSPYELNHNVSIIGWDDNFCANNPTGSVTGDTPISAGAWLVSDSNHPNGNQFYYIAYDDAYIETKLIGIQDVSIGKRYNVYKHDIISVTGERTYILPNESDASLFLMNKYEKTTNEPEVLNKVGFIGRDYVHIDAYYIPKTALENQKYKEEGIYIGRKTITEAEIGYYTLDVSTNIEIPKGEFAIGLDIIPYKTLEEGEDKKVKILLEAKLTGVSETNNIVNKNKSFVVDGTTTTVIGHNLVARAFTSNREEEPEVTYLVSYDLKGGSGHFPSVRITEGSYVENTQTPTRTGYKFIGWTPDPSTTPITKDTTFEAIWELIPTEPTNPTDPEDPTNPTDPNDPTDPEEPSNPTDPEDPTNPIDPVTTEKPANTATFVFGYGKIAYVKIGVNGYIEEIPIPEKREGYRFLGWNPDPKKIKATEDTVFYGLWEKLGTGGNTNSGNTDTEYTQGTKNDGTQANIRIPNAGKSISIVFIITIVSVAGIVFYIKYRKIDK